MKFFRDILGRADTFSSKKLWFNGCCLVASIVLIWICYKDTMEDWAFICLYSIYLGCIGGFEMIPKVLAMVLEFKTGRKADVVDDTVEPKTANS